MASWNGIDEFAAVATTGSFTAGARLLGVSTTHMSRSIASLEARLQARLLDRTTRMVRLTHTGQAFLERCQRMIVERDEAIALVSERDEPHGELRITCSAAMGERFIAPISHRFWARYPNVSLSIELSNRVVDLVGEGYDLAVRTGQILDTRLIGTQIASRRLYTCATPAYLDRKGRPATLAALQNHDCLVGTASNWQFSIGGRAHSFRPHGRWRCNSGSAIVGAALAGLGLCQLPEFYVLPFLATGELEIVLEGIRPIEEPIWAVYPQRRHLSPKISRFVEMLRQELPAALAGL